MRRWLLPLIFMFACADKDPKLEAINQAAHLTTRQLIAGLNAKNMGVLASVLVTTSTTGSGPRALTEDEMNLLVFPGPPYTYGSNGKPGYMLLKRGKDETLAVRLIPVGDTFKVLATRRPLSSYQAELENRPGPATPGVDVMSFFVRPE